jgi:hypothetical protein
MKRLLRPAALVLCLVASHVRAEQLLPEPSRGLLVAYPFDGDTAEVVSGTRARAHGVRPAPGHDGRPDGALWFDGGSWVDLGMRISPATFTVSAWVRPDALDRPMVIVSRIRDVRGSQHRNLELRINPGGRVFLHVPGGRGWDGTEGQQALPPGRWTHVSATYDGTRAQIWVNGVRDGGALTVSYAQTAAPMFVGARPEGGGRRPGPTFLFQGAIEDVRIWDRPLGDAELLAVAGRSPPRPPTAPSAPGYELLARYPLEGNADDVVGRAEGTIRGEVRPAEGRQGKPGGALAFGGKGWIDLGARVEPERFTLAAWVRPASTDADEQVVYSKYSRASEPWDRYMELRIERGGRPVLSLPGGDRDQPLRGKHPLPAGHWSFLAITFDGDRAVLYVDGAADAEARLAPFAASRGPAFLGARPGRDGEDAHPWSTLQGRLADVQIFRGVLEPREVAALFQTGDPRPRPVPVDDDGRGEAVFLLRIDRLIERWDAAVAGGDGAALDEVEERILHVLDQGEDSARAERNERIAGFLHRAAAEIQAVRGRRQPPALDRKRIALARLAEALWGDLVEDLPREGIDADRPRRRVGPWY